MEQPTHTPLWIFKHENFILKNDLSPQIYMKCIYVTHIMYIKCICIMYTKSLSLLSSAPLGPVPLNSRLPDLKSKSGYLKDNNK